MTAFGPRQEPTERPASKGHPEHPNPAGQYAIPPKLTTKTRRESGLPGAAWWFLILLAAILVVVVLVGVALYV
jgi:hypothetical protein